MTTQRATRTTEAADRTRLGPIELALIAMLREAARTRADRRRTLRIVEDKAA